MASRQTQHDAAEHDRYVFVVLPRCPACGSDRLKVYGHEPRAEAKTQYTRCRDCEHKFLTVWEESENCSTALKGISSHKVGSQP